MSCSHAAGCPLFPLLRASLQGWRDYYCDSEDQWLGCARYQVSLTGERVPISLLPNGARARHLEDAATGQDRSGAAGPEQAPPPQHNPWPPESASRSQIHDRRSTGAWSVPVPCLAVVRRERVATGPRRIDPMPGAGPPHGRWRCRAASARRRLVPSGRFRWRAIRGGIVAMGGKDPGGVQEVQVGHVGPE